MEHLQHFGLRQDPFQNEPDLRFYFGSASHAEPQRRVERGLRQWKGLSVLTGEAGTGKTLLSRRILEGLEEELFDAQLMVILPGASDANSVLGRYARLLGVETTSEDRPGLLAQVYEKLAIVREDGRHSVLILDDCHLLDRASMAEIGGLLNLEYEDRRLLSLMLVGLPEIDVTLSHEASLGQRVDIRGRLEPLDYGNTTAYLLHRLAACGGSADIIPEEALNALFKYGRGRPRLLNTLGDNALFEAYIRGARALAASDVERAASDLGIGSEPGNTFTAPTHAEGGIGDPLAFGGGDPGSSMSFGGTSGIDDGSNEVQGIGDLLGGDAAQSTELTTVMLGTEDDTGSAELSEAVEAVLGEEVHVSESAQAVLDQVDRGINDQLPVFEARNSTTPTDAEATRIAFLDESLTSAPEDDGALDDLFVELIDE